MSSFKIEKSVRQRLTALAHAHGRNASDTVRALIDEHDRRERFAAVAAAYRSEPGGYASEISEWDEISDQDTW